ncbi:hypothetical protein [Bradyrhizobium sp. USDA 10063]
MSRTATAACQTRESTEVIEAERGIDGEQATCIVPVMSIGSHGAACRGPAAKSAIPSAIARSRGGRRQAAQATLS